MHTVEYGGCEMKHTTTAIYRNNRNENKYIEVRDDGYSHWTVRQYMFWQCRRNGVILSETKNFTGDGILHRWRKENLAQLLADYTLV